MPKIFVLRRRKAAVSAAEVCNGSIEPSMEELTRHPQPCRAVEPRAGAAENLTAQPAEDVWRGVAACAVFPSDTPILRSVMSA